MRRSQQPWWTAADQAEYDVLIDEFVGAVLHHRAACSACKAGQPWCAALRDCFTIVEEWRSSRELRSKAEWLRERRDNQVAA